MRADCPASRDSQRFDFAAGVHLATAALLSGAAFLKTVQLSTEPVVGTGPWANRLVLLGGIQFEILLAAWLFSGFARRAATWTTLGVFVMFLLITADKAIAGQPSCGCFGKVAVPPSAMLGIDALIVLLLSVSRPRKPRPQPAGLGRAAAWAAVTAAAVILSTVSILRYRPAMLSPDGVIEGSDANVLLEPETWKGRTLPIARYVDMADQLGQGEWTAVLYHHDCPECVRLIRSLAAKADQADKGSIIRVMLIEMPPYGDAKTDLLPASRGFVLAKLDASRNWFAPTPVVLQLSGGKVADVQVVQGGRRREAALAGPLPRVPVAEGVHDLGYVKPASTHVVAFRLDNPSPAPLGISKTVSECSCLTVIWNPRTIAAGTSDFVQLAFVAPAEPSPNYAKRVMVHTGDPRRPTIPLTVAARVGTPVIVQPQALDLGVMLPREQRSGLIELVNTGDKPVRPIYCTSNPPGSIALIPRAVIPAGGRLSLPVRTVANEAMGRQRCALQIRIESDLQPEVTAVVEFDVRADYRLSAGSINLGTAAPGERRIATIEVTALGDVAREFLSSAELIGLQQLEGKAIVVSEGRKAVVRCELTAGGTGELSGTLRLRLVDRQLPVDIAISGAGAVAATP